MRIDLDFHFHFSKFLLQNPFSLHLAKHPIRLILINLVARSLQDLSHKYCTNPSTPTGRRCHDLEFKVQASCNRFHRLFVTQE